VACSLPVFGRDAEDSAVPIEPRLKQAIDRALAENPDIAEMEHRIAAARERVPQAGALPDPLLTVGALNVPVSSFSFDDEDMTMKMVSLEQMLPARGKRDAAERLAEADLAIAQTMHVDHVNRLVAEVADSYFELASLDERISVARRSLERLGRISESVLSRYRVGQGTLPDALLAGVEETKARDRLRALVAERDMVAARFNVLQNLPPEAAVAPVPRPNPAPPLPAAESVSASISQSPAVRAAEADVKRAEEDLEVARLGKRLDVTLMTAYGQRDDRDDMFTATVGINLPFLQNRRVDARVAEKGAELSAARSRLAMTRLQVSREVREAMVSLESEAERSALYRDTILTQAETAARAAEEAYAVGKVDFQTYVRAALAVDEGQADAIERETAASRGRARLQAATGLPFFPYTLPEETHHE
jgi:outer membrane protein TolC